MTALPDAVRGYARRLHTAIGDGHHIASPLGAWLVLALAAPAAGGPEAMRLAEVLGMPVDEAARAARALLDEPHPAVAAAAAAWTAVEPTGPAGDWLAGLPASVERGRIPTRDEADAWARRHTYGLIEKFPVEVDESLSVLLASALATRITWLQPFDTTPSREFRSDWRDRVTTVLRTPHQGHDCAIVRHDRAGDLAVHHARADGLVVTSVIADVGVAAAEVLAAAHDVAPRTVPKASLFDLPLGDGPSWTITETDGIDRAERFTALLPAWSARSKHDLAAPGLGFDAAGAALALLFDGDTWEAKQAAVARYHRRGFEAAAVTALAVAMSAMVQQPGRQRHALLRFDRPYAVVASIPHGPQSPWTGLPVFSAWVTDPDEVTDR